MFLDDVVVIFPPFFSSFSCCSVFILFFFNFCGSLDLVLLFFGVLFCIFCFEKASHSECRFGGHKTARLLFKLVSRGQIFLTKIN